jgi:hypothetical protein
VSLDKIPAGSPLWQPAKTRRAPDSPLPQRLSYRLGQPMETKW